MGKYSIIIDKLAQKDLQSHFKAGDKVIIKKIEQIFDELAEHPETGTGKPEILKYNLSGTWSRRINREHRIVYEIHQDTVHILSAKGHY
jgi:toxin YoeB